MKKFLYVSILFCSVLFNKLFAYEFETPLNGTVFHETIEGEFAGHPIVFDIYLPPGYNELSDREYPTIYYLHGKGAGRENPNPKYQFAQFQDESIATGLMQPVIIVAPNSREDNMWADTIDGSSKAETAVIHDLIPHIDSNYKTVKNRQGRIIEGFSMGGYGAALYASKFPQVFSGVVMLDGALHSGDTLIENYPTTIAAKFGYDAENPESKGFFRQYFRQYSIDRIVMYRHEKIKRFEMDYLIYYGSKATSSLYPRFNDLLRDYNIQIQDNPAQSDIAHNAYKMLAEINPQAYLDYIFARFSKL